MPLLRSALPLQTLALGESSIAVLLRWAVGGAALFGYHAISSATSLYISPPIAVSGKPYVGTLTIIGAYSSQIRSMYEVESNACLSSPVMIAPGLYASYTGNYTATITGTPSVVGTYPVTIHGCFGSNCSGSFLSRTASLTVTPAVAGPPTFLVGLSNTVAHVGADVMLSTGVSGYPTPQYSWMHGTNLIAGATNSALFIPAAQLTNSGLYTMVASNSYGTISTNCILTMVITPGVDATLTNPTNHIVAGTAITLKSYLTNVPGAINTYTWEFNYNYIGVTTSNLSLNAAQTVSVKSGVYTTLFNSYLTTTNGQTVTTNYIVSNWAYDSFWQFVHPPVFQVARVAGGLKLLWPLSAGNWQVMYANSSGGPWYPANVMTGSEGTNATATLTSVNQETYFRLIAQ